ncbi:aldehyde dehydrogenase [Alkalicoccus saliphilus]|jgi:aldehyde dehydrogenase (NAD+)|uniref:Aldehyde dehydrogenase n=1 Tax=Alkalicoccus saliphilus TaxID=200989 RepID=A0A2T4U7G1_9BACI|nr:aldehyde dehydrogenase [Alkalicoccus saliphilus]PTL39347.1 aldehyde dehydrogenase family protein [Alkalicoccus saliphilus]
MEEMVQNLVNSQKAYFYSGATRSVAFRKKQLKLLKEAVKKKEHEIMDALKKDLNKGEFEAYLTEVGFFYSELKDIEKNMDYWAAPQKQKSPLSHTGSTSYIYKDPYGVTLIISPWNYPFQLALTPLIGAIAAGNTAIIKPSEFTPNTSMVIRDLIASTFAEEYVAVVEGEADITKALLAQKVDYIFFTGSRETGKKVMEQAAKNLTPLTLELGGKSPAIVTEDADLKLAAKRIVWGKFMNAGQTCVAPDYVLVDESIRRKFLKLIIQFTKKFFGPEVRGKRSYPRIVSENHVDRLAALLDKNKISYGGGYDRDSRKVEPTIMMDVQMEDAVMQDEIFGPILPIMSYQYEHEILDIVRQRPNPLALYLFTENKDTEDMVLNNLSFGGGCVNDTIMHITTPYLPFGGVGESGHGAYHGKDSFDTFTHRKSILKQTTKFDLPVRYNPSQSTIKTLRKLWE